VLTRHALRAVPGRVVGGVVRGYLVRWTGPRGPAGGLPSRGPYIADPRTGARVCPAYTGGLPCRVCPSEETALRLNPDPLARRVGFAGLVAWLAIATFYVTWDGWLYEWRDCGFAGPNQHFDLDLLDMRWDLAGGAVVFRSLSNLHNLLYLCDVQLLLGALGLLLGVRSLRQGSLALLPLTVSAVASTIVPLGDHLYPLQWAYDLVHLSGMSLGAFLLARDAPDMRAGGPWIWASWGVYLASKVACCKWPFWEHPLAFFSLNQINHMPFSFFGLEYLLVVGLLYAIGWLTAVALRHLAHPLARAILPVGLVLAVCTALTLAGLVRLQDIHTGTCPT
jgi:hypothetical protein